MATGQGTADAERIESLAPPLSVEFSSAWTSWQRQAKRLFDVIIASLLLIMLAPVFALIALTIRLDSAGPVFHRQIRVGRNGKQFKFLKFRGMVQDAEAQIKDLHHLNEADGPIFKMRDDPRVTRVGRVIRRLSLDELPQLWNVIRGDMSLVGPRPPIPSEVLRYESWQHGRLAVVPGMTGLWQVTGRQSLDFRTMVHLDLEYIERWSFWFDFRILIMTVPAVLFGPGAY